MERLTIRTVAGTSNLNYPKNCYFPDGRKDNIAISAFRQRAIDRLAAYEDAEEQGLWVRLPCKVGDKAFVLESEDEDGGEEKIFEGEVISFSLADGQAYATIGNMEEDCWFSEVARPLLDIGIDWFLSRTEVDKLFEEANRNG